jgi:hypothetical protein
VREELAGGRPFITVSQCCVSARKRRIWRCQRAAVRRSQREGAAVRETVVEVVALVVVMPVVVVVVVPLVCEAGAAAAAVVRPTNASRSPQAKIERRNLFPP